MAVLTVTLADLEQLIEQLPEPPKASMQAISMLEDINCPLSKASEFIAMDETLTSKLLKLANSAYYAASAPTSTVKDAIARVGVNIVKSTLFMSVMDKVALKPNDNFKHLWESALFTAFFSRDIAHKFMHPNPDLCFTSGLLCDVGQLLINEYNPDIYTDIFEQLKTAPAQTNIVMLRKEWLGFTHMDVGKTVADKWRLPNVHQTIIRYHHTPQLAKDKLLKDDLKLLLAVHMANNLSPLLSQQNGFDIQYELMNLIGARVTPEIVKALLEQKRPLYQRDIEAISKLMFG